MERDEDVRPSCFAALDVLCAQHGDELPYAGALERGFAFRGRCVPFLAYQKGIYRAAAQRGPAALSLQTSARSPYEDEATEDGFLYAYRAGSPDHPDNRALRAAFVLQVPIVYFVGTRPGWYRAHYPWFVEEDRLEERRVRLPPGHRIGPPDEPEPVPIAEPVHRRYAVREARVRLHQSRFRWRVIPAYDERCTVCRLRQVRLLDAAHICPDLDPRGEPVVANGLSLCSLHHRAFDQDLVGISPDCRVHVSRRLLEDEDGPMLELLKGFHDTLIHLPRRPAWRPDPALLEARFERFRAATR